VKGNDHPFPIYRTYGVPVELSTDDEGVSRSDLTQEFERAVLTYQLSYADVKQLAQNSIEYSFAAKDDKAKLKADLEKRFAAFEKTIH
jgi:adenosine deaminase